MKPTYLFTILVSLLMLSSCSTYQYVTLEDASTTLKKASDSFKDSIEVFYSFPGDGGTVVLEIRNNSGTPIIVDKTKTNLIKDEKTISFWDSKSRINTTSTSRQSYIDERNYYTDTEGEITNDPTVLFIPPSSKGKLVGPKVQTKFLESFAYSEVKNISIPTINGNFKGEQIHFNSDTSPHQYRVFLTILKYGSDEKPIFLDQTFNATTITNTNVKPDYFNKNPGKQFYIKKATGFGTFMGGVAAIGLFIIAMGAQ